MRKVLENGISAFAVRSNPGRRKWVGLGRLLEWINKYVNRSPAFAPTRNPLERIKGTPMPTGRQEIPYMPVLSMAGEIIIVSGMKMDGE